MNTEKLATVYVDNQPLSLADAMPKVSAILFASGKPSSTKVKWLQSRTDTVGKTMQSEEVVDRTSEPSKAIYLTCTPATQNAAPVPASGQAARSSPTFVAEETVDSDADDSHSEGDDADAADAKDSSKGSANGRARKAPGEESDEIAIERDSDVKADAAEDADEDADDESGDKNADE